MKGKVLSGQEGVVMTLQDAFGFLERRLAWCLNLNPESLSEKAKDVDTAFIHLVAAGACLKQGEVMPGERLHYRLKSIRHLNRAQILSPAGDQSNKTSAAIGIVVNHKDGLDFVAGKLAQLQ